ncbi:Phage-related minor tail protein [Methylobacterium sp. 174MFSha1.1]|uniref:phage tail length tape measure family protein n=1 Tax=Methylobacterium sp. 174MFSha1.1 TaxID=1502749 RepID=UPI0008EE48C1|nr:phage tail length tape measure family protein [Methylobacterium sp. 174MFSha1.1]SFU38815.1 Phage-related minor tail protein [Methylobacterium sp. 174MFSha1.1]
MPSLAELANPVIDIRYTTSGEAQVEAAANKVAKAYDGVVGATERLERSQLSAERRFDAVQRRYDDEFRASEKLAKVRRELDTALSQNLTTVARADQLYAAAEARIKGGVAANDNLTKAIGLQGYAWRNLSFQANDAGTMLLSGSSAMQVVATQGGQVLQILQGAEGGVSGALKDIASRASLIASPLGLMAVGLTAAGAAAAAAYVAFSRYSDGQEEVRQSVRNVGALSGATADSINRVAASTADSGRLTASTARTMASEYARSGRVQSEIFGDLLSVVKDYGRAVGEDLPAANTSLTKAFASPSQGALELNTRFGGLTAATLEQIRRSEDLGNKLGAQRTLFQAFSPIIKQNTADTSLWGDAWDYVKRKASEASDAIGAALSTPGLEQRQRELTERLQRVTARPLQGPPTTEPDYVAELLKSGLTDAQVRAIVPTYTPSASRQIGQATLDLEDVQEQRRRQSQLEYSQAQAKIQAEASLRANDLTRKAFPEVFDFEGLTRDAAKFETALRDATTLDNADLAQRQLDQIREKIRAGGSAAYELQKAARDAFSLTGLNAYDRALTEIRNRYEELAKTAGGNAQILAGQGAVRSIEIANLDAVTRERARGQVAIPADYLQTIRAAESGALDNKAVSPSGAVGRYQFTASTWLDQFRRNLPDLYQSIRNEYPDPQGSTLNAEARRAILDLRRNPTYQDQLATSLTRENGEYLGRYGYDATTRNLYGAHNIGAAGIRSLLDAERDGRGGDSAQAVLDRIDKSLVANNASYYGGGKTVDQALATLERVTVQKGAIGRSQEEAIRRTDAETRAIGLTGEALSRRQAIEDQLTQARTAGLEVADRFKTADDVLGAKSKDLTGALKEQVAVILQNADARAKAASTSLNRRFDEDVRLMRGSIGRTPDEENVFRQASRYAAPGSDQFGKISNELREIQQITYGRDLTGGAVKGIVSDLMHGTSAASAFGNALSRIGDSLINKTIDSLLNPLFGAASGSGSGGLGGMLGQAFGFLTGSVSPIPKFNDGGVCGETGGFGEVLP